MSVSDAAAPRLELPGLTALPPGDLAVPLVSDERPLAGAAGLLDWRLCGALSRLLAERRFDARPGERLLTLGQAWDPPRRVLLYGLGPLAEQQPSGARAAAAALFETLIAAGSREVLLFAPASRRRPDLAAPWLALPPPPAPLALTLVAR